MKNKEYKNNDNNLRGPSVISPNFKREISVIYPCFKLTKSRKTLLEEESVLESTRLPYYATLKS
jgi:uncharacterized membrane protein